MLTIKKLTQSVTLPRKSNPGDAGYDVFSRESIIIKPHSWYQFKLGFAIKGEPGKVYLVQGRSGRALSSGVTTIGNVIDNSYRGEVSAILLNPTNENYIVVDGDKIAQILIIPVDDSTQVDVVEELDETERGRQGYGSTG